SQQLRPAIPFSGRSCQTLKHAEPERCAANASSRKTKSRAVCLMQPIDEVFAKRRLENVPIRPLLGRRGAVLLPQPDRFSCRLFPIQRPKLIVEDFEVGGGPRVR